MSNVTPFQNLSLDPAEMIAVSDANASEHLGPRFERCWVSDRLSDHFNGAREVYVRFAPMSRRRQLDALLPKSANSGTPRTPIYPCLHSQVTQTVWSYTRRT
jgi:hypothetical protein